MEFVYYKTKKDAINYDIFQHIMYVCTERVTLTHVYKRMSLVRYHLLHPDMIMRNVQNSNP